MIHPFSPCVIILVSSFSHTKKTFFFGFANDLCGNRHDFKMDDTGTIENQINKIGLFEEKTGGIRKVELTF